MEKDGGEELGECTGFVGREKTARGAGGEA